MKQFHVLVRGAWRAALFSSLAVVMAGCGILSNSSPTPTPIVVTRPPAPTPAKTIVVTTATATAQPRKATAVVVTATPKPKKHATKTVKRHPSPTPTHVVHKKPTATPHPRPHPSPTHVRKHPTATARPRPTHTPVPRPTHTPTPRPRHTRTPIPRPHPTHTARPRPTHTPRPRPTHTPRPRPTRTATPRPRPTHTPRPTPTHVPAGPRLGTISQSGATEAAIQRLADQGRPSAVFYRNPVLVLYHNLPGYGFRPSFTIVQPIVVSIRYAGNVYDVYLKQLAQQGQGGVWFMTAIEPHGVKPPAPGAPVPATPTGATGLHLGPISRTGQQAAINAIQTNARAGNANYTYYLNPIAVVERNLANYGFKVPVPIVQPLKIVVSFKGAMYDVFLVQPVKQGAQGVWVTTRIAHHVPS